MTSLLDWIDKNRKERVKDISEPVYTIVESFEEVNRWSYVMDYHEGEFIEDSETGFKLNFIAYGSSVSMHPIDKPDWLTVDEEIYLEKEIERFLEFKKNRESIVQREKVKRMYGTT